MEKTSSGEVYKPPDPGGAIKTIEQLVKDWKLRWAIDARTSLSLYAPGSTQEADAEKEKWSLAKCDECAIVCPRCGQTVSCWLSSRISQVWLIFDVGQLGSALCGWQRLHNVGG